MTKRAPIGVVVLAAGESSRLGRPKQLLLFRGRTLIEHAVSTALELRCGPVAVVLGAYAEEVRTALGKGDAVIVENPQWQDGMGRSLQAGLRSLLRIEPDLGGVLFLVCDQPFIDADALRTLVRSFEHSAGIVAAAYAGALGVPALFAADFFPELLALEGASGARQIIRRHAARTTAVPMPAAALDLDTEEDLERLKVETRRGRDFALP
jgi:molybdenum cofactor cytidylyltransferase